jgi:hypothetical protein
MSASAMTPLDALEAAEKEHSDYSLLLSDARLEEIIDLFTAYAADLIAVARAAQAYIRPDVWIEGHPLHGASIFPDLNSSTTSEALRDALAPLLTKGSE